MRTLRWGVVAVVNAAALSLVACGGGSKTQVPTGSVPGADPAAAADPVSGADPTGPTDAVRAAFRGAKSRGLLKQVELLACVLGGAGSGQFSSLFRLLSTQALTAGGIESDEFFGAVSPSFEDLEAIEASRSGNHAVVHVRVKARLLPDLDALRDLMKRNAADRDTVDDATIDAVIDATLASLLQFPLVTVLEHDVTVVKRGGEWHVCTA